MCLLSEQLHLKQVAELYGPTDVYKICMTKVLSENLAECVWSIHDCYKQGFISQKIWVCWVMFQTVSWCFRLSQACSNPCDWAGLFILWTACFQCCLLFMHEKCFGLLGYQESHAWLNQCHLCCVYSCAGNLDSKAIFLIRHYLPW